MSTPLLTTRVYSHRQKLAQDLGSPSASLFAHSNSNIFTELSKHIFAEKTELVIEVYTYSFGRVYIGNFFGKAEEWGNSRRQLVSSWEYRNSPKISEVIVMPSARAIHILSRYGA